MKDDHIRITRDFDAGEDQDDSFDELPNLRNDIRVHEPTARETFMAWEKLRILYNGILVALTLLKIYGNNENWGWELPLAALFANLCFCAAPVFEGYLCLVRLPRAIVRCVVFTLGTLVAAGLTVSATPQDFQ